jgi:hypothetical protein
MDPPACPAKKFELVATNTATPAQSGDVPGSKDPAFLKRYEGSQIMVYCAGKVESRAAG